MGGVMTQRTGHASGAPVPIAGQFSPTGLGGSYGSFTLSGGNLTVSVTGNPAGAKGYPFRSSGQYYIELTPVSGSLGNGFFVLGLATQAITNAASVFPANTSSVVGLSGNQNIYIAGTSVGTVSAANSAGVAVCIAVDLTAGLIWFRQGAGTWNASGTANPATGVGGKNIASVLANGAVAPFIAEGTAGSLNVATGNLGGSAFAQTAPSGYVAWN